MSALARSGPASRPYHWWGLPWTPPNPMTITDLVATGTIDANKAAWLRAHVRAGGSVAVASRTNGAGKSTLAHALIEDIDPCRTRVYVRGNHEPFDWMADAQHASLTLLINEISPHLPVYCWDGCARTVLGLVKRGFQTIATLHAGCPAEVATLLTAPPVDAHPADVVALDVVVFLDMAPTGRPVVSSISRLASGSAGSHVVAESLDP